MTKTRSLRPALRTSVAATLATGLVAALTLVMSTARADSGSGSAWSYPEDARWGPDCESGAYQQSPIDFTKATNVKPATISLSVPATSFTPSLFAKASHNFSFAIPDHVQVQVRGQAYQLTELHIHTLAEHYFDLATQPMIEVHIKSHLIADPKKYLVFAIPFWVTLPAPATDLLPPLINLAQGLPAGTFDLGALLTSFTTGAFYDYTGSLTTPGCTGGVEFLVLQQPLLTSVFNQVWLMPALNAKFGSLINARKTQPIRDATQILIVTATP